MESMFQVLLFYLHPPPYISLPTPLHAPNVDVQHHSFLYLIIWSSYWECFEMGPHEVQSCFLQHSHARKRPNSTLGGQCWQ